MSGPGPKLWWVTLKTVKVGDRVRTDLGDLDALEASIRERGLLQPLVVNEQRQLLAGYRRFRVLERLGWQQAPAVVVDTLDDAANALKVERDENTCRKDFTPLEAVHLGRRLEELERPKARERMSEAGKGGQVATPSRVRDAVGEAVGMSGRTYEKAKAVITAAEDLDSPAEVREVAAEAVADMNRTGKVDRAYREVAEAQDAAIADIFGPDAAAELAASKLAKNAARLRQQVFTGVLALDPERVALVTSEELGEWHLWQSMRERINDWCDRLDAARPKPFTVVEGGQP